MSSRLALLLAVLSLSAAARAEQNVDPLSWLGRIVNAAQRLNYSGVFVYQSGEHTETSRITHVVDNSGEREKLEVLDGSPREVVRNNDEVRCFLPEQRVVIVERQPQRKSFPARLPTSLGNLTENYKIRKGDVGRVADRESQLLVLEPKDSYRYGHMLWADMESGLLLKARMVNEKNETIEQFYFTAVQIGGIFPKDALKPKLAPKAADWSIHNVTVTNANPGDTTWTFRNEIPGFRQSAGVKRSLRRDRPEAMHLVFSDGLAAMSVFIEPLGEERAAQGETYSKGAISIYKRAHGDYMLTVLGEVPPRTLKKLADGMEPPSK